MSKSDQINELAAALAKAQGEIKPAIKDAENPFFKSSYADLSSVWESCRQPLSRNGLAVVQTTERDELGTYLLTTLLHASGQWISSKIYLNPKANDPQAVGSAITYYRRYALQAIVGIAAEVDDDAEKAMGRDARKTAKPAEARPTPESKAPAARPAPRPQGSHTIRNVTQVNGKYPPAGGER